MESRPLLASRRVKFFTRSFSLQLYCQSRRFYESAGYPCVRLTDQTADGYFYTMLRDVECDLAINVDEDAFIEDLEAVLDLAEYVLREGYANAGTPDAWPGCPRSANPIVTNPFFNILDLRQIRTLWRGRETETEVLHFCFDDVKEQLIARFDYQGTYRKEDLDYDFVEPYYNFFFWLALHFRTLYLPSYRHSDKMSTVLCSPDGRILCKHSWMSRFYGQRSDQTLRIDSLIDEVAASHGERRLEFTPAQLWRFRIDKASRFLIRIPQRVAGWPRKWLKWYKRWQRNRRQKRSSV